MSGELKSLNIEASNPVPVSEICFCPDIGKWAIKITGDGIVFNRELYPEAGPEDFANCFIEILERNFDVKFEKRNQFEL